MTKLLFWMILGLGVSFTAHANVKWVQTNSQHCLTACQASSYKFAVPAGINPRATKARGSESMHYTCAVDIGGSGWRGGYNVNYQAKRCYTGFRGSEQYGEYYYCLCSDKEISPIGK